MNPILGKEEEEDIFKIKYSSIELFVNTNRFNL
jgi:hypothetical protein